MATRIFTAIILAACVAVAGFSANAATIENRLSDPALESAARDISKELRCMTCSGESIYDSRSPLAANMREKVRKDVAAGKSAEEIKAYFVDRYGDQILMAPPTGNYMLWLLPALLSVIAIGALLAARRAGNKN